VKSQRALPNQNLGYSGALRTSGVVIGCDEPIAEWPVAACDFVGLLEPFAPRGFLVAFKQF
jgi:hypothetical protein